MSELYVLRRANGQLFTERINDKLRIPVWSSAESVARYRERNPELLVFLPARLGRPQLERVLNELAGEARPEFFLLADDTPAAELDEGRPIPLHEIFPPAASQTTQA